VLYHSLVHAKEEQIVVVAFAADAAPLAAHLDRYLIREDVKLELDDVKPVLVVGGENVGATASTIAFPLLPASWMVMEEAPVKNLEAGDRAKFDILRVTAGWPLGGVDFGEGTLPQELSRDRQAISFNKGCYLGQETVARLDALGHVNKQMVRLRAAEGTTLSVGDELFDGEKLVGTLTTCTPHGRYGLSMVRRGSNAAGTELRTAQGTARVEALDG
jgi:folate-binding protein YgfZ